MVIMNRVPTEWMCKCPLLQEGYVWLWRMADLQRLYHMADLFVT